MSRADLETENLTLVLQTRDGVLSSIEAMSPLDRAEISPEWLARVKVSASADPWMHGFVIKHRATGTVVGSCAYKGPPDADGMVEIAYGVDPAYQGRGFATEAALALVAFAFTIGRVTVVRAHTKSRTGASTHVLTKSGFSCIGEAMDPEDGLVWRWERRAPTKGR